jgi:competence protein CoiA
MLDTDSEGQVDFGGMQSATVPAWLDGILNGSYQYRKGSWNLN